MFRVEWLQVALDELTNIWVQADSPLRRAITTATNTLDKELTADPYRESESREGADRVLFVYPLGAHIDIDPDARIVWVLHVWRFRRRGE